MNHIDLKELIQEGESSTLEFKRKLTSNIKIAKEISAFANTIGGYLLIGVDDDGKIIGVESEKADIDQINTICEFYLNPPVKPEINIINVGKLEIVVLYIGESQTKPHKIVENPDDKKSIQRAYIRVGEKSIIASREMSRYLSTSNPDSKPITLSIGDKERRFFIYLEKHERATVKDFSGLVNISYRRAERLLIRLVRAGVLQIHNDSERDYFTLVGKIK